MPAAACPHEIDRRVYDLIIIGAGINGAGIARDAAGRGLAVLLCEQGDIGGATSSASSKLIHGGLRYLEHGEFRLVAEALSEREILLRTAPHLARPLRFVLPHARMVRPAWMVRLGLALYDVMSRAGSMKNGAMAPLPGAAALDFSAPGSPASCFGSALKSEFSRGYAYYDVSVDDARLTLATVRAAADLAATVLRDTRFVSARRQDGLWLAQLAGKDGRRREVRARALVNAAGPWVARILEALPEPAERHGKARVQLVKGSHIVVRRLYPGSHAYLLQNDDGRVVFLIPFERDFTLVGTTEVKVSTPDAPSIGEDEIEYLCRAVNRYSRRAIAPEEVVWSYAGVRPLYDDGHGDPSAISRDYHFLLDRPAGEAPVLSIFGGKLTTYRRLAERALSRLAPWFPAMAARWTATQPLPGGDFGDLRELDAELSSRYSKLPAALLEALARRHGRLAFEVLGDAAEPGDLGRDFGAQLCEREVEHFIAHEWAMSAEDILWRRTKAGLSMPAERRAAFQAWLDRRRGAGSAAAGCAMPALSDA